MIKSLYPTFQYWSQTGSVYIISDPHFEDRDMDWRLDNIKMLTGRTDIDSSFISEFIIQNINKKVFKNDTLIILGDVGNPEYVKKLRAGYKILIMGNHDTNKELLSKYFDEVYEGALTAGPAIYLTHEPVFGKEICNGMFQFYGHQHNLSQPGQRYPENRLKSSDGLCCCVEKIDFTPISLSEIIKTGILKNKDWHRQFIDRATKISASKQEALKKFPPIDLGQATDLSGKQIGRLKILYRTAKPEGVSNKGAYWACVCECGNIIRASSASLGKGTISCGCYNRERASADRTKYNLDNMTIEIGETYHHLTVLQHIGFYPVKNGNGYKDESYYLVQCDCGSVPFVIRGASIGYTQSCGCIISKGEEKIGKILTENNIKFKKQYVFEDLPRYRFDFAIFDNDQLKYLIEFDGRQHFEETTGLWHYTGPLEEIQARDDIKNQYCLDHNIVLKRIPYWDLDKFTYEDIIDNKYNIKENKDDSRTE